MDQENTLQITKSRCPKLAGGVYPKPGKEVAVLLKEWLGDVSVDPPVPETPKITPVVPKSGGALNGNGVQHAASAIPGELASIWKRMCSPRGVIKELEQLKSAVEGLAGTTGGAEYGRLLRVHGAQRANDFKTSQSARLCAKDVYDLLEQLRANVRENRAEPEFECSGQPVGPEVTLATQEVS